MHFPYACFMFFLCNFSSSNDCWLKLISVSVIFFVKTILFRAAKASAEPSYIAFLLVFPFFDFFLFFKSRKAIAGAIIDLLLVFFDSVKIFVMTI